MIKHPDKLTLAAVYAVQAPQFPGEPSPTEIEVHVPLGWTDVIPIPWIPAWPTSGFKDAGMATYPGRLVDVREVKIPGAP